MPGFKLLGGEGCGRPPHPIDGPGSSHFSVTNGLMAYSLLILLTTSDGHPEPGATSVQPGNNGGVYAQREILQWRLICACAVLRAHRSWESECACVVCAVQLYNGDTDAATGPRTDPDPLALTLSIYFSTGICRVLGASVRAVTTSSTVRIRFHTV